MVKCPVCKKRNIKIEKTDFEMIVEGRLVNVCGNCYKEAYLRTNFKRIMSNRGRFLSETRGKSEI